MEVYRDSPMLRFSVDVTVVSPFTSSYISCAYAVPAGAAEWAEKLMNSMHLFENDSSLLAVFDYFVTSGPGANELYEMLGSHFVP